MAVCSISVVPIGTGSASISSCVARCQEVLRDVEGIKYRLTPMATIVEGDVQTILKVVADLHSVPFESGAKRALTTVVIDDRIDKKITMDGKLESVGRELEG
jgi:uncharacterized protein (TIGR00106 family)